MVRSVNELGILTAVWQRPDLTRHVLSYYSDLLPSTVRVAVCSTSGDKEIAESCGWDVVMHKNQPLSDKWQRGVEAISGTPITSLLTVGSDDFVSMEHINQGLELLGDNDFVDASIGLALDQETGRMMVIDCMSVGHGGGRIYNADTLAGANWRLFPPGYRRGLDGLALKTLIAQLGRPSLNRVRTNPYDENGNLVRFSLGIKTDVNLWPYDFLEAHTFTRPAEPSERKAAYDFIGGTWLET